MDDLTKEVLRYQRTGEGLTSLVEHVSEFVYRFPSARRTRESGDGAELLLRFMPRITTLIERYRHTGQSFESYLVSSLRWQLRTMASETARDNIRTAALVGAGSHLRPDEDDRADGPKMEVHESSGDQPGRCERRLSKGQSRRLLYFALKLTERLGEDDYRRVARAAGCSEDWVVGCWETLRAQCADRRERQTLFCERRDRAWFRMRCAQYRLQLVLEPEERDAALRQLEKWRRKHLHAIRILKRMRPFPTHGEIAEVLGVPKGSVDSSLYYGKRSLASPVYRKKLADAVMNT